MAPFLATLCLLTLYIATLAPSVAGGDSGELTAAALTGGVPHPSGYPLFALLARAFAALPLGHSPAWRVNLLSAVSTAAAGGLVCSVVQAWTRNTMAGLTAAALFGTDALVWSLATHAEVFGLNAMFVALAFYFWARVERTLARRDVLALLFASGLAMCNHHTFVFVGGPLVLRSLWVARRKLGGKGIALALAVGLAGLAPYLYLLSASASDAAVSWGDDSSIAGLVAHVLRLNYGTFHMGRSSVEGVFMAKGTFLPTLWHMWGLAFPRLLWLGAILSLVGFYLGIKRPQTRKNTAVLLFVFCLYSLTFCALSNLSLALPHLRSVLGRFCIESDLLLALACGLGFAGLAQWLPARGSYQRLRPVAVGTVFALGIAVSSGRSSARNNTVYRDFITSAFTSLPPGSILITSMGDDVTGAAFYFHEVEGLRGDVVHLDSDYLAKPWYTARKRRLHPEVYLPDGGYGNHGWNLKHLLDGNPNRPIVFLGHLDDWDHSWQDGYKVAALGLCRVLVRASEFPDYEAWAARDRLAIGTYDVTPALRAPDESWERALGQRILDAQIGRAHLALLYGYARHDATQPAGFARQLLEDVVAKSGGDEALGIGSWAQVRRLDTSPALWKDLGLAYQALASSDEAYIQKFAISCSRFVARARPDDPDLPAARKYLAERHTPPIHGQAVP